MIPVIVKRQITRCKQTLVILLYSVWIKRVMASSGFKFIAVEIPKVITIEFIKRVKSRAREVTAQDADILNSILKIDLSDVEVEDIGEDDLFEIGKDSLRAKRVVSELLLEAIDKILVPRISLEKRIDSSFSENSFIYIELENKLYAASGESDYFYSSRRNKSYQQLLALNMSGILNDNK